MWTTLNLAVNIYCCLYWAHALIRHYLRTGRKYALIKKHALNKHVRLLARLYGNLVWPVDWLNQNSGYNGSRILVLPSFFYNSEAFGLTGWSHPQDFFSSLTGLNSEGCGLQETESRSLHAISTTPDNINYLNYLHGLYFLLSLSYYRYLLLH